MPAPLAKGLVLSISLIFAAGVAIYENPQVKHWVDENRRKVAVALHNLGDELAPQPPQQRPRDVSTREDDSPEAAERRRRARQQIFERGRVLEERRRGSGDGQARGMIFDDLVNKDGSLKTDEQSNARTTAAETHEGESNLRHRTTEADPKSSSPPERPIIDTSLPTPENNTTSNDNDSRASTPTLPTSPPVPPKPAAYRPESLLINTDEESTHPSDQLVDFTPTTSPRSASADLHELNQDPIPAPSNAGAGAGAGEIYMSVNEWAHNQSVQSFHSLPQSPPAPPQAADFDEASSVGGSMEHASQAGTEDMEFASSFGDDIVTPSTWTEVGSQVSED